MDLCTMRSALLHVLEQRAEKEARDVRPWAGPVPFERIARAVARMSDPLARGMVARPSESGACTVQDLDRLLGMLPTVQRERRAERAARRRWMQRIDEEHRVTDALEAWGDGLKFYEVAASAGFDDPDQALRILERLEKAGAVENKGELGWCRTQPVRLARA